MGAYLPLWQAERAACLRQLLAEGCHVIFSCVKSPWFDASWIGRRIDKATLATMEAMARGPPPGHADVAALDLGGEKGEYHTMCLSGPLHRWPVTLEELPAPTELVGQPGQKDGERWWTLGDEARPVRTAKEAAARLREAEGTLTLELLPARSGASWRGLLK